VSGECSSWGRENSPAGPWRFLPADTWPHVRILCGDVLLVPGNPPIKFYNVRVAPAVFERITATALTGTIAAEGRCREWLIGLMSEGTRSSKSKSASQARTNARLPTPNRV
jgi:hypothetical protein